MKLSMWILADWLEKYSPVVMIQEGEPVLRGVRLFSTELIFEKQNVYLGLAREFVTGYRDEIICVNGKDMIVLRTNDVDIILNEVFSAFDYYNKWTDGLMEDVYSGCLLQHIVDVSTEILDDPVIVFDYSYIVKAISSRYEEGSLGEEWDHLLKHKSNRIKTLTILNSFLHKSRKIRTVQHVFFEEIGIPCMNRNLFEENANKGLLLVLQQKKEITKGRMQLTESLGSLIERWMVYNREKTLMKDETTLFVDLLEGRRVIKEDILQQLLMFGWKPEDKKVVLKIATSEYYKENVGPFMLLLEKNFLDCVIVEFDNSVVLVVDLALIPLDRLLNVLQPILKKSHYYCGVSYEFEDVVELKKYHEQAFVAIKYAPKKNGGVYYCGEFAMEYILSVIRNNLSSNMAHPAVDLLKKHDREKGTEFYNTLYHYLDNERSIIRTSEKMNIHRNTLLYRLEKIKDLIHADLEDSKTRFYLMISLKIIT